MPRIVYLIAIAAVFLRFGYQDAMLEFGGSFHNGSDSGKYLSIAEGIGVTGNFVWVEERGGQIVATAATDRMPVYPYLLAGVFELAGPDNLQAVVRLQAVLEALTIVGLALAAAAIERRLTVPTAIIAAIIPNFLVHSSYVLTENIFLLLFVWGLCALLWSLHGRRVIALLVAAGVLFGAALLTRPVLLFFPLFLFPTLFYALVATRTANWRASILLALVPIVMMAVPAAPRVIENYAVHGHAVLSTQTGNHLTKWIYPCLRTPWTCSSIGEAWLENNVTFEQRLAELPEDERTKPFVRDRVLKDIGKERILELGIVQITIGMAVGAFKNIIQTGFYETLTQFNQPPQFFSAMSGESVLERLGNFFTVNATNVFMIAWFVAQGSLMLSRVVQLVGLGAGLTDPRIRPFVIMLTMTVAYFLLMNGPIANPKYRIPAEPGLIILLSMGLYTVLDWYRARRSRKASDGASNIA
jgi:4-amino-4-deoxy-L-arabinose transferase-like glycosyltransferase